jgi:hypothetical protein
MMMMDDDDYILAFPNFLLIFCVSLPTKEKEMVGTISKLLVSGCRSWWQVSDSEAKG